MWEEDESDIFDEMEKLAPTILGETFSRSSSWFFDLKRNSLRPLYRVEVGDEGVIVTFDLPGVEKEDISLSSTEEALSIAAEMKRPVSLMVGGFFQKRVRFEKYRKKIHLPVKVEPDKAKAIFRNGLLRIRFPSAHKGTVLRVE